VARLGAESAEPVTIQSETLPAGLICSGVSSSIGGDLGIAEAFTDEPQLPEKQGDLNASDQSKKKGESCQNPSSGRQSPFVRRMFVCAALFVIDLGLALWGGENFYRKRYLIGTALVASGANLTLGARWRGGKLAKNLGSRRYHLFDFIH
jgi:hypothetical protein